ncbi:ATP-binding cassette sub- C member 8 [Geranomyces michiganensis]|nr:ATP-binding cassette sub- C member 8 [Geranomyces michiganensis]
MAPELHITDVPANGAGKISSQPYIRTSLKNPFSFVSVSWLTPLMKKGFRKPLQPEDMFLIPPKNQAAEVAKILGPFWVDVANHNADPVQYPLPPSLFRLVLKTFWKRGLACGLLNVFGVGCELAIPVFIRQLLTYITPGRTGSDDLFMESGLGIAFCLLALQVAQSIGLRSAEQAVREIVLDVRTILVGAVYEKNLRLSGKASRKHTHGSVMQMINVDVETISTAIFFMNILSGSPFQVIVAMALLFQSLGVAPVLTAIATMIFCLVVQAPAMAYAKRSRVKILAAGDKRVAAVRELLAGIKIVKLRAWEALFSERISALRQRQTKALAGGYYAWLAFISIAQLTPTLMPITAFIVYSALNGSVTAVVVFPAIVLFNILTSPMFDLPQGLSMLISANVSWKRITTLLHATESAPLEITPRSTENDGESKFDVVIKNATFKWEAVLADDKDNKKQSKAEKKKAKRLNAEMEMTEQKKHSAPVSELITSANTSSVTLVGEEGEIEPLFRNLNLTFEKGALTAIVGEVGSGKSSLLSAIIGEMTKVSGTTSVYGTVAYAPQQPWIQTGSIRQNIAFKNAHDEEQLNKAVRVCGLDADVKLFSAGLETELGEHGINLSGGQKSRVALARAVYQNCDIYCLDDPISALDSQVGGEVFNDCIKGALAGKTRLLVTHHLHLLREVDKIIVLDRGNVAEEGTYAELMERDGVLASLMQDYQLDDLKEDAEEDEAEGVVEQAAKPLEKQAVADGLIVKEDRVLGAVAWRTYKAYITAAGGFLYAFAAVFSYAFANACMAVNQYWLVFWTERRYGLSDQQFLLGYALLGVAVAFTNVGANAVMFVGNYMVAIKVHARALQGALRAPMGWFDTQPLGRLIQRFTRDLDTVDARLWADVLQTFISVFQILSTLILCSVVSPWLFLSFLPLLGVGYWVLRFYRATFRELKRLDSVLRSPLYAQISETLTGLSTIKAYGAESHFVKRQRALSDVSSAPYYLMYTSTVWIGIRLQLCAALIPFTLAILGVEGVIDAGLCGLAFTYALPLIQFLDMLLRSVASLESDMNAIERLEEYAEKLPQEAPSKQLTDPTPGTWPTAGEICIKDLELRYPSRPDTAVIRNLSVNIKGGWRVGVVGRTGSGKSTLLTALFRIVEPSAGSITIDGVDIATLGLDTLRRSIDIIPQEPTLFKGTLRQNLDIEGVETDEAIWELLEEINLKTYVSAQPGKLDAVVSEKGENLSVGQRQLICLGRSMLKKPKILVMDEATAAIDGAADERIQALIRDKFKTSTIIVIAHRLSTIVDFDRTLVMDAGEAVEFDTPHNLLSAGNEGSHFSQLVDATGAANAALLRQIAADKERSDTIKAMATQSWGQEKTI